MVAAIFALTIALIWACVEIHALEREVERLRFRLENSDHRA